MLCTRYNLADCGIWCGRGDPFGISLLTNVAAALAMSFTKALPIQQIMGFQLCKYDCFLSSRQVATKGTAVSSIGFYPSLDYDQHLQQSTRINCNGICSAFISSLS